MKPVHFLDPAKAEMGDAAEYYERQADGLGEAFVDEIERVVGLIQCSPRAGGLVGGEVRRRVAKSFPFNVLYVDEADEILVVAVMHQRRRPDYWRERLSVL